jgi:dethiobiotin synthetase
VHRYFVTGTDTGVGKTRVTAALAAALKRAGCEPSIVKLVQTGVSGAEAGDAAHAGAMASVRAYELERFALAADPWSAALAEGRTPPSVAQLVQRLDAIAGPVVVEGAGGALVPLNPAESMLDAAHAAQLRAVIAVGLRMGCINHALLTLEACARRGVTVAGCVLVECWEPLEPQYGGGIVRALQGKSRVFGILRFDPNKAAALECAAGLFEPLLSQ